MPRSCGLAERGNRLKSRKLDRVKRGSGNESSEEESTYGTSWSCTASCHLQGAVSLAFLMTRSADTCAKGEPTGKDGEDVWNRGHIDPAVVVFLDAGCALLPVGVRLALIGWPDKQATHFVLRSDLECCESISNFSSGYLLIKRNFNEMHKASTAFQSCSGASRDLKFTGHQSDELFFMYLTTQEARTLNVESPHSTPRGSAQTAIWSDGGQ